MDQEHKYIRGRLAAVGPGWWPIIDQLDAELAKIDPDYTVLQIKEKFGGLRYYWSSSKFRWGADQPPAQYKDMANLVAQAELKSFKTCEECGAPGITSTSGGHWMLTLCEEHRKIRAERLERLNKKPDER